MPNISDEQLTTALASVIQNVLSAGGKISISGLGTFSVHHEPSQVITTPGARVKVKPPRNVVSFAPDVKPASK